MSAEAITGVARRSPPVRVLPGYDLASCVAKARRALKLPAPRLLDECCEAAARDRAGTVDLLVHLGAIEARRVHRRRGCGSLFDYCTQVLGMCEATASRRIGAARAARRFPVILPMLADGRLHLTAVSLLSEHPTPANVASLLAEATHQSKAQVERLVARRFPKQDIATAVRPLAAAMASAAQAAQSDSVPVPEAVLTNIANAMTQTLVRAADGVHVAVAAADARVSPRSEGRFAWQLTADQDMQNLFEEARELIGFNGPRELPDVLKRGLQLLVQALRKARFAETERPRRALAPANARHVPAHVKRAVAERDGHQCAYVSDDGKRCRERTGLQYDHVTPLARGGQSTVANTRLLCGPHNQSEAERWFGEAHVREQREAERARREHARAGRQEAAQRARGRDGGAGLVRDAEPRAVGYGARPGLQGGAAGSYATQCTRACAAGPEAMRGAAVSTPTHESGDGRESGGG